MTATQFGELIRQTREEAGLSQEAWARRFGLGDRQYACHFERGRRLPRKRYALLLLQNYPALADPLAQALLQWELDRGATNETQPPTR